MDMIELTADQRQIMADTLIWIHLRAKFIRQKKAAAMAAEAATVTTEMATQDEAAQAGDC